MAERNINPADRKRETASVLAQTLMTRLAHVVRRPGPAQLRPTIYVPVRRGEEPDWRSVVARNV